MSGDQSFEALQYALSLGCNRRLAGIVGRLVIQGRAQVSREILRPALPDSAATSVTDANFCQSGAPHLCSKWPIG